jgi:hypothetical protein
MRSPTPSCIRKGAYECIPVSHNFFTLIFCERRSQILGKCTVKLRILLIALIVFYLPGRPPKVP